MERACPACGQPVESTRMGVVNCPSCDEAVLVCGAAEDGAWEDRRAFSRYRMSHRVLVRSVGETGEAASFRVARLHDLSGGGACIEGVDLPGEGTRVDVVLATGRSRLLNLSADVRHCRRHDDGTATAGLEFTELTLPVQHCLISTARTLATHKDVS